MAYEFKKLGEVEALDEVPENANALVEVDGAIKRVPGSGLGGAAGIKTAIIKTSDYDDALAGVQTTASAEITYSCINMTFEEAYATMAAGEPLAVMVMMNAEGAMCIPGIVAFAGTALGYEALMVGAYFGSSMVMAQYWTADGFTAAGG